MDYEKLEELHSSLSGSFGGYSSMIAVGSIVVGDPWVEGRSDRDILFIFEEEPSTKIESIEKVVCGFDFDKTYKFFPMIRTNFGRKNSKYSFSNVFRSETLFGEDLIPSSQLPDRETIQEMYEQGLENVRQRLGKYIADSVSLSEDIVRDKFWKQFKHAFMHLAVKSYFDTGNYPLRREDTVRLLEVDSIRNCFDILHSIDSQPKEKIVETGRDLLSFLERN